MEENNKSSNSKILIIALTVLLFALIGYTFYNNNDHKEAIKFLQDEKEQIIGNLTAMEEKYDIAIAENTSLSDSLTLEKEKIALLKDSVQNLKKINSDVLRRYRNQLASLEKTNERLLDQVDSLMFANNILTEEKDSINSQLEIQTNYNDTLVAQNMELARKVEIGGAINVENVEVTAMKMRSNGKYTETNKAQKTDAIKVEFRLLENEIAEPGDKEAYIVLKNPAGQVINAKGTFLAAEGAELKYTDQTIVNYSNANLDVVMLVERKGEKYEKGTYPIAVYVEGKLVGSANLELSDSFLGL
jgi:chromosome segregation ATPase